MNFGRIMTEKINLILNNEEISIEINPALPLLDYIRQYKHLYGTKEGCKEGDCGACTVLIGTLEGKKVRYRSINSCLFPVKNASLKHVVTIEGINNSDPTPVQKAFINEGAAQCGFCTPGFIVSLTGFLINNSESDCNSAINSIGGNLCRCTGYTSIKKAVQKISASEIFFNPKNSNRIKLLVDNKVLPEYFLTIPSRLQKLEKENTPKRKNHSPKINLIGGGTDLYVQKPDKLLRENNRFMFNDKFDYITVKSGRCELGSMVTFEMLKESKIIRKYIPGLESYMNTMASLPIRNSATLGGNIINASPIADSVILLIALDAELTFSNGKKSRKIPLSKLYKGYKILDRKKDELLEKISFALPKKNALINFEKVSKREYLDIASVNSAVKLVVKDNLIQQARISVGGVAPIPLYLEKTSRLLIGKRISPETIMECIDVAWKEISPISDIRGSREYKSLLTGQIIKSHFLKLFPEYIRFEALV